ncbi:hypothetical protein GCM10018780_86300 [Streptomyces lanatus]|nr:hypothetical protein GCM10018780_86300 [Streptomyces lanatus]
MSYALACSRATVFIPQNSPEPAQGSLTHRVTTCSGCSAGHPVAWAAFDEGHIAAPPTAYSL